MHYRWLAGLLVLVLLMALAGCSDEQKEEAARLEQELMDQEGEEAVEPVATEGEVAEETVTAEPVTPAMDAGAIPEEETPEEPQWEPPTATGSGYVVQIASCEDRDYAQYLVEKYTRRGYEPFVSTYDHLGQAYYRVRLGPVETLEAARALKAEVMDRYSLDAVWIDRQ